MSRNWVIAIVGAGVVLLVLLVWASRTTERSDEPIVVEVDVGDDQPSRIPREELVRKAQEEGQLYWYTSAPEAAAREFLAAFEKKHGIGTELFRGSTFDVTEKLNAELSIGAVQADALHVLDVAIFLTLKAEGELLRYDSPEYEHFPRQFREDGYWAALRAVAICMAYNQEVVPPEQAPKRWEDLVSPEAVRWQSQLGLENPQSGSQYCQYYFLRDLYGVNFWRGLSVRAPRFYNSSADMLDAVLRGDLLLAAEVPGYAVYDRRRKGHTELVPVYPEDGVPMVVAPLAIPRRAPHPHAARLFLDFALSEEGQTLFQGVIGAYSVRDGVEPLPGKPKLSDLPILAPSGGWEDYLEKQRDLRAEFSSIFYPSSE
ncbi:MAG: ABC transporter substrate-binding protein [Armatimonadota bacterium]